MKNFNSAAVICVSLALFSTASFSQKKPENSNSVAAFSAVAGKRISPETMPVSSIRRGMRGVAYTVFEGTKPEPMDVEILGILPNMNGPKSDIILARLHGKAEYTGVVAGMSGSPVYIDGKLIGALSYRIGSFSKEPIAGITPIEEMLEINEMDSSLPPEGATVSRKPDQAVSQTAVGGNQGDVASYAQYLTPIEAPFVFNGFNEETVQRFAPQFKAAGLTPVMGIGGAATNQKQPEPIEPGSAVSAVLVSGDLNIAGTCTVTYMDADHLLACGHPLTQFGMIDMPMTKAEVVTTLSSPLNSFKIVNTTEPIGAFVQDRHTGIMGKFEKTPQMIPVNITVHGGKEPKDFHFNVLNNAQLTPLIMMATIYQSLQSMNQYGEEITYRMRGGIDVSGYPSVQLRNMFAAVEGMPTSYQVAMSLGDHFNRIFDNPYRAPKINAVNLDFDLIPERRAARLETARTDLTEARPGDEIMVEAVLRPYRGERIVRQIPLKIPTSTPKGTLRILVSDGDTLDRAHRVVSNFGRKLELDQTITLLNNEHVNHSLYVSLLENSPQALVQDKVMPSLPVSVMNVMDGMRGTQDMVVTGESAENESSTPVDYVVSGAQIITVQIK